MDTTAWKLTATPPEMSHSKYLSSMGELSLKWYHCLENSIEEALIEMYWAGVSIWRIEGYYRGSMGQ